MNGRRLSPQAALAVALIGGLVGGAALVVACSSSGDDEAGGKTGADAATNDASAVAPPPGVDAGGAADAAPSADATLEASVTDAAASDAGRVYSTDRSTFFGASRCAATGALFCDGFEEPVLDGGDWTLSTFSGGTPITLSTAQAARGTGSVHVLLNGSGSSRLLLKKIFPVTGDRYFGRLFVYFDKLPRAPMTYAHWSFAAGSGTGAAGMTQLSSQLEPVGNLFGVGTNGATGDWTTNDRDPDGGPEVVPVDQWLCIEWMNDGTAEQTRFWWDGVEHPSLATSMTVHGGDAAVPYILPEYDQAWIGFDEYQDAGAGASALTFEAWLDEIAYDSQRIGCSN